MSDSKEITLAEPLLSMLKDMELVFQKFGIDYFIAGAFARDIHFLNNESDIKLRKTDDVDIAVYLRNEDQFHAIIEALEVSGLFVQNHKNPIKLIYKSALEVDLIPFGGIEDENRDTILTKPKVFILQMPGFLETFPFIEDIRAEKLILKTCPLEGLVMLKLLSNNSKPDRTHDLIDIDNIIDAYFDWYADEIYTTHSELFEIYDVEDLHYYMPMVAAHLIGRKMNNILKANTDLKNRIIGIVEKKENPRLKAIYNALRE